MRKLIAIVAGEPNSINSEIIAKAWRKVRNKKNLFIIGNYELFKNQLKKIKLNIKTYKITSVKEVVNTRGINILDIPLKFKSVFKIKKHNSKKYVLESLNVAHKLAINKKIIGFINAPVDKRVFSECLGVTEYLAKKNKIKNQEVMMIYNESLSVVPLTTHLEIKNVTSQIKSDLIEKKIFTLNKFYLKLFKKKPKIGILGLNPHNSENRISSVENRIVKPTIKKLRNLNINITGPFPADTAFNKKKRNDYDVIVGMYHDQVLAPFKAIYGYNAINITLGLNYLRSSPDHGTAQDIIGLNKANPQSMIAAINFFNATNN